MLKTEVYEFKHNGFDVEIVERPDKAYCKQAHGRNGDKHWFPRVGGFKLFFDKDLLEVDIERACKSILDTGSFKGRIETYPFGGAGLLVVTEIFES
jgi:hypothetical protein